MSQYARTYNSFSGIDISPVFNGKPIGECQGLSYSVSREKAPLYTLGSPNPRSFSRGKRGIAGAVVFLVFDRSSLFESMKEDAKFYGNTWEQPVAMAKVDKEKAAAEGAVDGASALETNASPESTAGVGSTNQVANLTDKSVLTDKKVMTAYYHDQIPNFNVKLIAATERGHGAIMEIIGMEILNTGSGVSVDDTTTDESCSYIATQILPWHSQTYNPVNRQDIGTSYTFAKQGNDNGIAQSGTGEN
jgi:hypothetical protein